MGVFFFFGNIGWSEFAELSDEVGESILQRRVRYRFDLLLYLFYWYISVWIYMVICLFMYVRMFCDKCSNIVTPIQFYTDIEEPYVDLFWWSCFWWSCPSLALRVVVVPFAQHSTAHTALYSTVLCPLHEAMRFSTLSCSLSLSLPARCCCCCSAHSHGPRTCTRALKVVLMCLQAKSFVPLERARQD